MGELELELLVLRLELGFEGFELLLFGLEKQDLLGVLSLLELLLLELLLLLCESRIECVGLKFEPIAPVVLLELKLVLQLLGLLESLLLGAEGGFELNYFLFLLG